MSAGNDNAMKEFMNGNGVCVRLRLVSMYVFPNAVSDNVRVRMRGARCTAGKTATQREPVQARLVREAHQETAVERRSVWSGGRQDVRRVHERWFQKKQRKESGTGIGTRTKDGYHEGASKTEKKTRRRLSTTKLEGGIRTG